MKMLDLFAGIGGFSLAGHWLGWKTVAFVEWDKWCQKVLKKNFPNIPIYEDIKKFKGEPGSADIVCGGFPCQPFSVAGKQKGKADDRYLWPEMLRVISEVKPAFVVGENVAGLISMENGKTLEGIFSDLENEGYEVESFIIPACGVGAWHRRDRIWIIAYTSSGKCTSNEFQGHINIKSIRKWTSRYSGIFENTSKYFNTKDVSDNGKYDGIPGELDRIKGLGNAIVPQVAYQIFSAINKLIS